MKLIIGNQPIAIPADATISMEKSSPALNEKGGSFSYPFPVPARPNLQVLGWPGDLKRVTPLTNKSFILEDQGIQVLRGEVEFDGVTAEEIGVILKSGITGFTELVKSANPEDNGASLADLDWGQEDWFSDQPVTLEAFEAKLATWDEWNRTEDSPMVMAPFRLVTNGSYTYTGNKHKDTGYLSNSLWDEEDATYYFYMVQMRAWYMLEKIFENYGYTVTSDELKESEFKDLVILTRPFMVTKTAVDAGTFPEAGQNDKMIHPLIGHLVYANLMMDVKVLDFLDEMKVLMGLAYDIDDLDKEVKIIQLKNIISSSQEGFDLPELAGWQHKESGVSTDTGYSISFMSQDDELDTRSDFVSGTEVANYAAMGYPSEEGQIIKVTSTGKYYYAKKVSMEESASGLKWTEIGRLAPKTSGKESTKIEFNVKVPANIYLDFLFNDVFANPDFFTGPQISLDSDGPHFGMLLYDMVDIYVSIYRGTITNTLLTTIPYQFEPMPLLAADKYILTETVALSPECIYNLVYAGYLSWKSLGAKEFTKYIKLTIPQLLALNWGSSYTISGVKVILSKINYDLPFTGIVKIDGFVA